MIFIVFQRFLKELKEELKQEEEMERSGIATVNSKESIEHMKEFVSENKNNGSNLLKSKEENELFKEVRVNLRVLYQENAVF